jgi:sugar (pentulose or hexulose) kinase
VTYLALDIGDADVTAALWSSAGLVASGRAPLASADARDLWTAVETAVAGLAPAPDLVAVEAVGCSGSPATHLRLARDGEPLGSDADPARVGWYVTPRDFVTSLLTGRLATDPTMASATGFFTPGGLLDEDAVRAALIEPEWLPPQRGSTEVLGDLLLQPARRLGLRSRIPVVTGATAAVCAVEGAGALPVAPLVTYGSPVVVHVPVEPLVPSPVPPGVALLAGGRSYQLYEALVPGTAADVARLVEVLAPDAKFLCAAGDSDRAWRRSLPTATGLPVVHRRSGRPVTLGLAMLIATGAGAHLDRDEADPIAYVDEPLP